MDSTNLLQGTIHESSGSNSTLQSGDCKIRCSNPLMEKKPRPEHDEPLKCPRCDSVETKFCYYNNYSLSQPRYFCKNCRRYWTKGGILRDIPVGGGIRKTRKVVAKKSNHLSIARRPASWSMATNLHILEAQGTVSYPGQFNGLHENPNPFDFMLGNYWNYDQFSGNYRKGSIDQNGIEIKPNSLVLPFDY